MSREKGSVFTSRVTHERDGQHHVAKVTVVKHPARSHAHNADNKLTRQMNIWIQEGHAAEQAGAWLRGPKARGLPSPLSPPCESAGCRRLGGFVPPSMIVIRVQRKACSTRQGPRRGDRGNTRQSARAAGTDPGKRPLAAQAACRMMCARRSPSSRGKRAARACVYTQA